MAKPSNHVTPEKSLVRWKKQWGTPIRLSDDEAAQAFEEFQDAFVPSHMHKKFLQNFGLPKASFGNRFFVDEVVFRDWDTRIEGLLPEPVDAVDAIVIYGSVDSIEAHRFRGLPRRSLKDVIIDDWNPACAIVRAAHAVIYIFVELRMKGVVVRTVVDEDEHS